MRFVLPILVPKSRSEKALDERVAYGSYRTKADGCKLIADRYKDEAFCYLTTTGRVTGRRHEIEIWYALDGETLYMLSDSHGSDWVKNLRRTPEVTVRIADVTFAGHARVVEDEMEDELARSLLIEKYEPGYGSLSNWRNTALPVAVDLVG